MFLAIIPNQLVRNQWIYPSKNIIIEAKFPTASKHSDYFSQK